MPEEQVPKDELADLVARVARIEGQLAATSADTAQPDSRSDDVGRAMAGPDAFWAISTLKARQPQPAVLYTGFVHTAAHEPVEWQMTHDAAALIEQDWTVHAATLAALGHPSRLRILQLICRGEASTAADLAHTEGLGTTGQIYHHLRQLVAAGWLRNTTKGQHQVPPERLVPLLVILGAST